MRAKVREKISILFRCCASQVPEASQPENARSEQLIFLEKARFLRAAAKINFYSDRYKIVFLGYGRDHME